MRGNTEEHRIHYENKTELSEFAFLQMIDRVPIKRIKIVNFSYFLNSLSASTPINPYTLSTMLANNHSTWKKTKGELQITPPETSPSTHPDTAMMQ